MMPAYEVSRTLVKSPPEVWSELEKVERLAELLGDGTIEIVDAKAESRIEWRGERASGTIEISASGWGTKVKLTAEAAVVVDEVADLDVAADEAKPVGEDLCAAEVEDVGDAASVVEDSYLVEVVTDGEDEAVVEPAASEKDAADADLAIERTTSTAEPTKRVGFWKRLFGGADLKTTVELEPVIEPGVDPGVEPESEPKTSPPAARVSKTQRESPSEPEVETEPESPSGPETETDPHLLSEAGSEPESLSEPVLEPEPVSEQDTVTEPELVAEPEPEPNLEQSVSAESDCATGAVTAPLDYEAILTGVLDHLGSAHKRPFTQV